MTQEEKLKWVNSGPPWMYEFDLGDGVKTPLLAEELVARVRPYTDLPLAMGFGISTPQQVADEAWLRRRDPHAVASDRLPFLDLLLVLDPVGP